MARANRKSNAFRWVARRASVVMVALGVSGCVFQDPGPPARSPSAGPSPAQSVPPSPAPIAKLGPMDYMRFLKQCETQRQQINYHFEHASLGGHYDPPGMPDIVSSGKTKEEEKTVTEAPSIAERQYSLLIDKVAKTQAPPECVTLAASYDKVLHAAITDLQNNEKYQASREQAEKAQGKGTSTPLPDPTSPPYLTGAAAVGFNSAQAAFYKQHPETPHDLRVQQIPTERGAALTW